jgi:hypothetical protein
MNGSYATVQERFDCGVRMLGAARVMRVVDQTGYARIDAADRGQIVANIHVFRPVRLGKRKMRGVRIIGKRWRIGVDAAELPLPGMAMSVDEARDNNGVMRFDHLGVRGFKVRSDSRDGFALNQNVTSDQVADLVVHADNGAAAQQDSVFRINRFLTLEAAQRSRLCTVWRERLRHREARKQSSACVQRATARHVITTAHTISSSLSKRRLQAGHRQPSSGFFDPITPGIDVQRMQIATRPKCHEVLNRVGNIVGPITPAPGFLNPLPPSECQC